MKKIFIILAITGVLLQSFHKVWVLAQYEWNKNFIIENFCENRSQPTKQCDGKCYLKKQLQKADQQGESQKSKSEKSGYEINTFYEASGFCWNAANTGGFPEELSWPHYISFSTDPSPLDFFRPPQA